MSSLDLTTRYVRLCRRRRQQRLQRVLQLFITSSVLFLGLTVVALSADNSKPQIAPPAVTKCRDAKTGTYVTADFAKQNPTSTVCEADKKPAKTKRQKNG
jgi:hypothetical protein